MMKTIKIILIVCLFHCCVDSQTPNRQLRRRVVLRRPRIRLAMEQNKVVPDVIDSVPPQIVRVRYPSGVEVNLGNELTPTLVKDEPSVEWPIESNTYYTLIMTDPDAPSRADPVRGEIKHWIVMNIPGTQISSGETLAGYRGSGPPKGSGLHRYIFLVYKQNGIINHSETPIGKHSREGRPHFKVRKFAEKYGLGQPIAGNFYVAEYDNYVPIRSAMAENQMLPDVIDSVPPQLVRVRYPSGVEVNLGNELTPTLVKDEPSVEWPIEPNTFYTLVMTDPDSPSQRPLGREMKHWLVMNIPGNQISNGETLAEYRNSRPPQGSGLHRYIFLVYKQNGIINTDSEIRDIKSNSREGRTNFKVKEFAQQYGLGEPIAGNFYVAQYDDYVGYLRSLRTK